MLAALCLLALPGLTGPGVPAGAAEPSPAPGFGSDSTYCRLDDPSIDESSGLAVSTRDPDVLWTHNDSGDGARLFALAAPRDGRCATRGVLDLRGIDAFDAEDLAPGPNNTLWLADIGDNIRQRERIVLNRVTEPATVSGRSTVDAQRFRFSYPDGARDAEALLVSPVTGQVVVVSKGSAGTPRIYAAAGRPAASLDPAPADVRRLVAAGDLNAPGSGGTFQAITGGTVSRDGRLIVLRTYLDAYVYPVPGDDLVAALQAAPRRIDLPPQGQGEAVALSADGRSLLLSSEGRQSEILRLERESSGGASAVDRVVGDGNADRYLIAAGAGVALLLVMFAVSRRRRRY